jgi:hypothetical protein
VIVCGLCLAAGLCAAPLALNIQGEGPLRLGLRYLWFRRDISHILGLQLRRLLRDFLESPDPLRTLAIYRPLFKRPLELRRLRLHLAFSTGDAAETALLHGRLCLASNFLRFLPVRPEIALAPRFLSRRELSLDCDISFSIPAAVFLLRMLSLSIGRRNFTGTRRNVHKERKLHA